MEDRTGNRWPTRQRSTGSHHPDWQSWVKRPWFWLRWTKKEMSCDPAKKPPNSHPRLQEDASSTKSLASRRGCCISPCRFFGGTIPTRVPFLSFGMKGTERDWRVSRFLDEIDKRLRCTIIHTCTKKRNKKNIVNRLKPSQKLVSFAFVSAKLSTWRPRTGYLFSPKNTYF